MTIGTLDAAMRELGITQADVDAAPDS